MKRGLAIACLTIALTGGVASAASRPPAVDPHPDVPQNPTWVRGTLTGILLLFAFAIPVGIILRANMPDPPPAESHDEHGGGAHGHDDHAHGAHAPGHH